MKLQRTGLRGLLPSLHHSDAGYRELDSVVCSLPQPPSLRCRVSLKRTQPEPQLLTRSDASGLRRLTGNPGYCKQLVVDAVGMKGVER